MLKTSLIALLLAGACSAWSQDTPLLRSAHALVVDADSGEVLMEKDAGTAAPIASMTKLMTAMVVLDAHSSPDESIAITTDDLDTLKHTRSGVPVGAIIRRSDLLTLALMSSDNHAAAALARNYPGGHDAFRAAMDEKIRTLGLEDTTIEEPTGLSPNNHATARDMVKILKATAGYPEIGAATSQRRDSVIVSGRSRQFHNTNGLVGAPGWDIVTSKTGFTNEAGRCLSMRLQAAGRNILVVLMGAVDTPRRTLDALNVRRFLTGAEAEVAEVTEAIKKPQASVRRATASVKKGRKSSVHSH